MVKRLFREATNQQAFLKCGIQGFAGSGKTYTACRIARGLYKLMKAKKPIGFIDTETGSDWEKPRFDKEGINLEVAKTRAFASLMDGCREAEKNYSILVIDSISHFWTELMEAFSKKKNIKRLLFQHWLPIKQEWRVFTDWYVNSPVHIIMVGRAGWEYDFTEDEEGTKELTKTGTKMKAETEMGYEPSLLIEMEKVRKKVGTVGTDDIHRAWVIKDRADVIQGKFFDDPAFEPFLPHINCLNLGGKHLGVDTSKDSTRLFDTANGASFRYKKVKIALESIKDEVLLKISGQSSEDKKAKIKLLRNVFGTSAWSAIEDMQLEKLEAGLYVLKNMKIEPELKPKEKKEEKDDGKNRHKGK